MSKVGQYSHGDAVGEHRGSGATGRNHCANVGGDPFPDELHERRMEEDKEESAHSDGGVHVDVCTRANRDRHGFQLKRKQKFGCFYDIHAIHMDCNCKKQRAHWVVLLRLLRAN